MAEPSHNAEEQLRRYAEERRKEAAPELHPATRRMLQGEVARTYGAPMEKPASSRRWLLWPGFACMVALMMIVGGLQLRDRSPQKDSPSARTLEKDEARDVKVAEAPAMPPPAVTAPGGAAVAEAKKL